jgi:hypothetical protein
VPAVYHLNGLDPRLSQIIAPLKRTITDSDTRQELDRFAKEYQQQLVINRGLGAEARVLRAIIALRNTGQILRMGNIAEKTNGEEGSDPLTARQVGNVVRDSLRLRVHKAKGRYEVKWDQAQIDSLVGFYGTDDDEDEAQEEAGADVYDELERVALEDG